MNKRYFIYWDANQGINGNIIISFNPKTIILKDLISDILALLQTENDNIENITIKFMMELK